MAFSRILTVSARAVLSPGIGISHDTSFAIRKDIKRALMVDMTGG